MMVSVYSMCDFRRKRFPENGGAPEPYGTGAHNEKSLSFENCSSNSDYMNYKTKKCTFFVDIETKIETICKESVNKRDS